MTHGGRETARPPRWHVPALLTAQLVISAGAILVQASGTWLNSVPVTLSACALLLLFGLPHGTLDLELLRRRDADAPRLAMLLGAYSVCAVVMYALWQLAPVIALLVFFAIAVEHFAEDWRAMGSRFLGYGTAIALIATPALLHRANLTIIFRTLTSSTSISSLGDGMLVAMPVAGVIAIAGVVSLWQRGERSRAVGLAAALVTEGLLPPVIGFAIFFCFVHSPYQLREGVARLQRPTSDAWLRIIVPLTLTAFMLAGLIGAAGFRLSLDAGALRASFVTLSVLTLPHMLVPYGVRRYRGYMQGGWRQRPLNLVRAGSGRPA